MTWQPHPVAEVVSAQLIARRRSFAMFEQIESGRIGTLHRSPGDREQLTGNDRSASWIQPFQGYGSSLTQTAERSWTAGIFREPGGLNTGPRKLQQVQ